MVMSAKEQVALLLEECKVEGIKLPTVCHDTTSYNIQETCLYHLNRMQVQ